VKTSVTGAALKNILFPWKQNIVGGVANLTNVATRQAEFTLGTMGRTIGDDCFQMLLKVCRLHMNEILY